MAAERVAATMGELLYVLGAACSWPGHHHPRPNASGVGFLTPATDRGARAFPQIRDRFCIRHVWCADVTGHALVPHRTPSLCFS